MRLHPGILPSIGLTALLVVVWWWAHDYMLEGYTGLYNDDAVYVGSSRALAEGRGYVIPFVPGNVPADRFPIGFPALLSLFWHFPAELAVQVRRMQELVALTSVGFLALSFAFLVRRLGIPAWAALVALLLVGISPFYPLIAGLVMSDLPFALLLTGAMWLTTRYTERPTAIRLVPAVMLTAAAILFRYIGGVLALAAVVALFWQRRFKAGLAYGAATLACIFPWIWWVVGHRAFGYSAQIAHQSYATGQMRALSLAFSGVNLGLQAIPSLLWQQAFLPNFPERSPLGLTDPAAIALALGLTAAVLAGLVLACRQERWRFAVGVVALYLLVVLVWQTGFLNLGEHLTVRLLLPVAPLLLCLALAGWHRELSGRSLALGAAGGAFLGLVLLFSATGAVSLHGRMVRVTVPTLIEDRAILYGLLEEFARQVPPEMQVASNMEPLFHLVTGRTCISVGSNPKVMKAIIVRRPAVRFFVMTSQRAGTKDLTLDAIAAVNEQYPGVIVTITGANGKPSGVFRIERGALSRATTLDATGGPETSEPPHGN